MEHPIRRADVQADVERFTADVLKGSAGTGRILIEFDFKAWRPMSYRAVLGGGARRDLTGPKSRVG